LSWLTAFGDVGTAFQVPTTTELANPAGAGFNSDVDPQTATSTEVGLRAFHTAAAASVTGFVIDVRDVLVPYEVAGQPGRTFYRNASRARRGGVELEARAMLHPQLFLTTAFTFIDARFVGPANDSGCCADFHEPGIPPVRVFGELAYRPARGLGAAVEMQWTDDFYVDDTNTAKSPEAAVCNARLTYGLAWRSWTMLAALGLNNLFADRYDGRVRINAQGGRFFEPAAVSCLWLEAGMERSRVMTTKPPESHAAQRSPRSDGIQNRSAWRARALREVSVILRQRTAFGCGLMRRA
jgi:iron complex outermembrane receptor protein